MQSMEEKVKRGAALLDKFYPNWAEKVQGSILAGLFDMGDPESCILGSLELVNQCNSAFVVRPAVHFNGVEITTWQQAEEYGFEGYSIVQYAELEELWKVEIDARTA